MKWNDIFLVKMQTCEFWPICIDFKKTFSFENI